MDLQNRVPIFIRHFVEHAITQNACGADDRVEGAELIHGLGDHIFSATFDRHTV